jgi:hypothetical protein
MSTATPKSDHARVISYYVMTGSRTLTPRQRRRVGHKRNHVLAPFGKKVRS